MASTPEGKVKDSTKKALVRRRAYWHMPVQNGMGQPALDFHVCLPVVITADMVGKRLGLYVGVETKKLGGKPTPRQLVTAAAIEAAGGKVFFIDGGESDQGRVSQLEDWIP